MVAMRGRRQESRVRVLPSLRNHFDMGEGARLPRLHLDIGSSLHMKALMCLSKFGVMGLGVLGLDAFWREFRYY
jgi:hypothetical protein